MNIGLFTARPGDQRCTWGHFVDTELRSSPGTTLDDDDKLMIYDRTTVDLAKTPYLPMMPAPHDWRKAELNTTKKPNVSPPGAQPHQR